MKDELSKFLRLAEKEEIVITRHGRPAGILIGFESEDDWFDYRLENDPRFLRRIETARQSIRAGHGVRLEDVAEQKLSASSLMCKPCPQGKGHPHGCERKAPFSPYLHGGPRSATGAMARRACR